MRKYIENDEDLEEEECAANNSKLELISIPGSDEQFYEPQSIHEKYAERPDSLENICLAQFAIWYVSVPKNWKEARW